MQALSHSPPRCATIIYGNISHKKVGGGGLKDLTSAISRAHPHTYNFGVFRHRRKRALDKIAQMKYTSNNRKKFLWQQQGPMSGDKKMTVQDRWVDRTAKHLSRVSFTDHIYKDGSIVATCKLASDYPEYATPEGTGFWVSVYSDKIIHWVIGTPAGYDNRTIYQVVVHNDNSITRKLPVASSDPSATGASIEYDAAGVATGATETCYTLSRADIAAKFPTLTLPVSDDSSVFSWAIGFQDSTPTYILAYLETE